MRRSRRVVCPVCREIRTASWAPDTPGEELVVHPHARKPLGGLVPLDGLGRPQNCRGSGRRVGPEATPPPARPISYEETLRVIDALLGQQGVAS